MTCIVLFPIVIFRPYVLTEQQSIYSEDVLAYNDMYSYLFGADGGAIPSDFFIYNLYDVSGGEVISVGLSVAPESVTIYWIVIFIVDGSAEVIESQELPVNGYSCVIELDQFGTYGVAIFGHKLSNNIGIHLTFMVLN